MMGCMICDRCGEDFFAIASIRFKTPCISSVNETKNRFIPTPMDKQCAKKVNTKTQAMYVRIADSKNPIGFFQSNGSLEKIAIACKANQLIIYEENLKIIGIGSKEVSLRTTLRWSRNLFVIKGNFILGDPM